MPRKLRDLVYELRDAGFEEVVGGGKGSPRKFVPVSYRGAITLSGRDRDDAKPYQERQIQRAIEESEA